MQSGYQCHRSTRKKSNSIGHAKVALRNSKAWVGSLYTFSGPGALKHQLVFCWELGPEDLSTSIQALEVTWTGRLSSSKHTVTTTKETVSRTQGWPLPLVCTLSLKQLSGQLSDNSQAQSWVARAWVYKQACQFLSLLWSLLNPGIQRARSLLIPAGTLVT
jgi:hypothetical protein